MHRETKEHNWTYYFLNPAFGSLEVCRLLTLIASKTGSIIVEVYTTSFSPTKNMFRNIWWWYQADCGTDLLTRRQNINDNLTSFNLNVRHTKIVFHCLTDLFLRCFIKRDVYKNVLMLSIMVDKATVILGKCLTSFCSEGGEIFQSLNLTREEILLKKIITIYLNHYDWRIWVIYLALRRILVIFHIVWGKKQYLVKQKQSLSI